MPIPEFIVELRRKIGHDCANGDVVQWMDVAFRCRAVGGEPRVNDDESIDVGWFHSSALPDDLPARQAQVLADALSGDDAVQFAVPT